MMKSILAFFKALPIGAAGATIATIWGGWTTGMTTLCIFMLVDWVTGWIVAGVFHNSPKSAGGALESKASWKGLIRKGVTMLVVLVAYRLDLMLNTNYIRDAVVIAFVINEALSIMENVGLMGIEFPKPLQNGIELLRGKSEETPKGKHETKDE